MLTNLHTVAVMIVFAGGPHTESRTLQACTLLPSIRPATVYLTGQEYRAEHSNLTARVAAAAGAVPTSLFRIRTDACTSTMQSCRHLAAELMRRYPHGVEIDVVTSDYHAARVRCLLAAALPAHYPITIHTTQDISPREWLSTPRNRQLLWGELMSWTYCLPASLLLSVTPR